MTTVQYYQITKHFRALFTKIVLRWLNGLINFSCRKRASVFVDLAGGSGYYLVVVVAPAWAADAVCGDAAGAAVAGVVIPGWLIACRRSAVVASRVR